MEGFSHVDGPPDAKCRRLRPPRGSRQSAKQKKLVPNPFAGCDSGVNLGTVQIEVIFWENLEKKTTSCKLAKATMYLYLKKRNIELRML